MLTWQQILSSSLEEMWSNGYGELTRGDTDSNGHQRDFRLKYVLAISSKAQLKNIYRNYIFGLSGEMHLSIVALNKFGLSLYFIFIRPHLDLQHAAQSV